MLLTIAICDDEVIDCKLLKAILDKFFLAREIQAEIDTFSCGEDFLLACQEKAYHIVFMDIYMSGINGISTIKKLCAPEKCQIVFTTSSQEFALEAFNLNATHYLLKPVTKDAVFEAVERCLSRLMLSQTNYLKVKTNQGIVPIPVNNITYIEVFNKICLIHTEKSSFRTYASLNALSEQLGNQSFMLAQRSFLVNMNYIKTFYSDHIILQDGKDINLSRTKRTELKKQYQQFLLSLAENGSI